VRMLPGRQTMTYRFDDIHGPPAKDCFDRDVT